MTTVATARQRERAMLLLHVPAGVRPASAALLSLDDRLAEVFAAGRDATLRQIRLAWWRDALTSLDSAGPPPEPILAALAQHTLPLGITGTGLAAMADGWAMRGGDPGPATLGEAAAAIGGTLFGALTTVLGGKDDRIMPVGEGWALARIARSPGEDEARGLAMRMAAERLVRGPAARWSRRLRPLAMLAALARSDLGGAAPNTPMRAALLWRVRLTGR